MTNWWGTFDVPLGEQRLWRIGRTSLWVSRLDHEWAFGWESADGADDSVEVAARADTPSVLDHPHTARFGIGDDDTKLTIRPALADRAVVARPVKPFAVPAGHTVTVFVGSPVWIQLSTRGGGPPLIDTPLLRPSDTWFGPNTRTGELCYASRTACRLRRDDLPLRPHRAATAVTIRNQSSGPLDLQQLNLPVRHLSLHASATGMLWTDAVELDHLEEGSLAPLRISDAPPAFANTVERVAPPREPVTANKLVRAFASWFS